MWAPPISAGGNRPPTCSEPFVPQKTKVSEVITVPQQRSTAVADHEFSNNYNQANADSGISR
jgi:hypothetical protein